MMTLDAIPQAFRPPPLKFDLWDSPHCTIETNRNCNMRCRSCYNLSRDGVKPLDQVRQEVEAGLSKRNLGIVTLMGGEPTLHPDLKEIIRYVKSKNLTCQLLTNGLALLQDDSDEFLDSLKASGIDRVLVHIDEGQSHIYPDIEGSREKLFSKLEERKVRFSLSLTIYDGNRVRIPSLLKKYSRFKHFDGILAVLAREPLSQGVQGPELVEEYHRISKELHIEPLTYIPSNLGDADVRWLVYFYFINALTGRSFALSPKFYGIFRWLYRRLMGHQPYIIMIDPRLAGLAGLISGILESLVCPRKIISLAGLLKRSNSARDIRFHYLVIQTPPEFTSEKNKYRLCYHCPDATIRNGKLTPVCIADIINPLSPGSGSIDAVRYDTAYGHLEEL